MALPAPSPRDQRTTALRNDAVRCAAHELVRCGTKLSFNKKIKSLQWKFALLVPSQLKPV